MGEFESKFEQLVNDGSSDCCGQMSLAHAMEKFPDVSSDELSREHIAALISSVAIDHILDGGKGDYFVAQEYVTAILILGGASVRKIRDLRQGGKQGLVLFFGRRAPCNCIEGKYEEAKKMPKFGMCDGCMKIIERRKLKLCACQVDQYCSTKCQREAWADIAEIRGYTR